MSRVAEALGVSRSQLHARTARRSKPRGPYSKPDDAELRPALRKLVDARPTYGCRRITALLNRRRRGAGLAPVDRKRVLRILARHGLTLQPCTGRREGGAHDGKVEVMASNLRWCSDALEIACWNGETVRVAARPQPDRPVKWGHSTQRIPGNAAYAIQRARFPVSHCKDWRPLKDSNLQPAD